MPGLSRRALLLLFLLGLTVRVAAVVAAGPAALRFGDGRTYLRTAAEIVRTGRYPIATERLYFRAPGYPYFLAAVTLGNPGRVVAAKLANAVLGAAAPLALAAISARVFRRRGLTVATGIAGALHPGFVYSAADVQSEPLFLLLLAVWAFLMLAAADRPSSGLALAAGASLALSALTRPSALVLAPMLAAFLFDRRYPLRARAHISGAAFLGLLLTLFPWTLRNARVFGEFLPVTDIAGGAFYQGNSDWTIRFYGLKSRAEYLSWSREMFADMERQVEELERAGKASPASRSRAFFRRALEERKGKPAEWARLMLRKAWDWLRPYPSPLFWPRSVVLAVGALYTLLFVLAAVGLATAPRPGVRAFVLVAAALTMAAHVALVVVWRYRMPYWDPPLLLYAVFGADRMLAWRRPRP